MEFTDLSPVSPRPRKTLKGVDLRAHPFQGLCLLKHIYPDADRGNFAQDEGSFAQVRCKISSKAHGDGVNAGTHNEASKAHCQCRNYGISYFSPVSPRPRKTLKGVDLRAHPFQGLCLLKQIGPDADRGNFAQDEGSFAQVRCKISSKAHGDGVMLVH